MEISTLPLKAMLYRLRDATYGFNAIFASIASAYGVTPFVMVFPETIYAPGTKNFIWGQLLPDDAEECGVVGHNRMTMYVLGPTNFNLEKPRDFSGIVNVALDVTLEWVGTKATVNYQIMALAVEDVIAQVLQAWKQTSSDWGAGVVYNGTFAGQYGKLEASGASGMRQLLQFRFQFQIDV